MKIQIKNLRSINDSGLLDIKPITILLGQNSSGKSTLLRTFPLLKQSIETRTRGPILWYGRYVDFGDFSSAINEKSKDGSIQFTYEINLQNLLNRRRNLFRYRYSNRSLPKTNLCVISIDISSDNENRSYTSKVELRISDFTIEIFIGKNNQVEEVLIDNFQVNIGKVSAHTVNTSFFPQLYPRRNEFDSPRIYPVFVRGLHKTLHEVSGRVFADETTEKIIESFNLDSNEDLLRSIKEHDKVKTFSKKVQSWTLGDKKYKKLKGALLVSLIQLYLDMCDEYISGLAKNTSYIAPLRATAERYYRLQDLSVEEVDFQGKNLALVLRNFSQRERKIFEEWCEEHFHFYPKAKVTGSNLTVHVKFKNDNSEHNIADLGFGFSQILPIITQLWIANRNSPSGNTLIRSGIATNRGIKERVFAIEQPELHLHPKLQAHLINAIISVINYTNKRENAKISFVLETHSETIINTIGNSVYKKQLPAKNVNVLIFEKNPENPLKIRQVDFSKDGTLIDWPYGFFEGE